MAKRARTVDLDTDDVRRPDGSRITSEQVRRLVEDTEDPDAPVRVREAVRGRPSLGRAGSRSPQVTFRLPEDIRAAAADRAREEGTTVSQLARRALERYLAS